ncbi:MAG: alpha/beta hydrolase [Gammaproteobacteria bacterium]|nr:alpha/beta hydrolase [Gammaproteobacteria bacterium]
MRITHRKGYVDGPFGQLHYMTAGEGQPLVMIHQSPDSMVQFEPVMSLLADHGIRAIAADIPGYGMSDTPDHPPTIAEYAQMIPALLDGLGLDQASLLGHHTGALIVTEASLLYKERVDKLILNGPLPLHDEERAYFKDMMSAEKTWGPKWDGSHFAEQWAFRFKAQPEWSNLPGFNAHFVHGLLAGDKVWYAHDAVMAYHHEDVIPQITHPTLVLANTGDAIYAQSQRTMEMRPDFAYAELAGGTIDIIDEQPAEWAAAVAQFLA